MDIGGGPGVEAREQSVQGGWTSTRRQVAKTGAKAGVDVWRREEAVQQCAKIETGAARDDREPSAAGDAGEGLAREPAPVSGGEGLVGVDDIKQVVRNQGALVRRRLGGADLHLAIDGYGIAADDLAGELLRQTNGE